LTRARLRLGAGGESLAARWYEDRGYQVLVRNWRSPAGELDLVVRRDRLVAFCEVKTRSSAAYGTPAMAVGADKQRRVRRLAAEFLATQRQPGVITDLRFDVAAVVGDHVEMIEAAF
jgi:putative endonuclease